MTPESLLSFINEIQKMLNLLHDYLKQTIESMRAVLVIKTFNIHRKPTVYIQPTILILPHIQN